MSMARVALRVPPAGTVDVWTLPLPLPATVESRLLRWLSRAERDRLSRFVMDGPRRQFLAGRGAVRSLLARYAGVTPREVRLTLGPKGKPCWEGGALAFNLSHSEGLLLVGISSGLGLGVDVERIRPVAHAAQLLEHCFGPSESAAFENSSEGFLRAWVCKEAALKACGLGVADGWRRVQLQMQGRVEGRACGAGQDGPVRILQPGAGYVAAVAADRDPLTIRSLNPWGPRGLALLLQEMDDDYCNAGSVLESSR
jgi:4'-phosphopantetheinyl transferase